MQTVMPRSQVYQAIDSERQFQDIMSYSPLRPDMVPEMTMGEIIAAMEHNLAEARRAWYTDSKPYPQTTEYLRKVSGLAVKAMEQFGVSPRMFS
jgi:hypothetical protein